jgi:predicted ATP-grasp superfamily ATP-dependent carboligase
LVGRHILVLDAEQRSALAAIRSLGRAGAQVFAASSNSHAIGFASRFVMRQILTPSPLTSPADYVSTLASVAREFAVDMVMPCSEQSISALVESNQPISSQFSLPDRATYVWATDKARVMASARSLAISTPEEVVLESPELEAIPQSLYPVVVKPGKSLNGGVRHVVQYAETHSRLKTIIEQLPLTAFPVLIQQQIRGFGQGVFVYRTRGQVAAIFAHERIREVPISGGAAVASRSIALKEAPVDESLALLEEIDWQGVAMVEWKRSTANNRPYLMEINPRLWGSLQLAIDCGVDFPRIWACDFLTGSLELLETQYTRRVSRTLLGELEWMLGARRYRGEVPIAGRSSRSPWYAPLGRFDSPVGFDTFALHDSAPFVRECITWIQHRVLRGRRTT